jgi:hypothetical protein
VFGGETGENRVLKCQNSRTLFAAVTKVGQGIKGYKSLKIQRKMKKER